jgi:superfamily II DNA/RNA helicase
MRFEDLDLTDDVLDALYDMNFDECTPIQEKAIPAALQHRDLIAVAQTGTGKTAAFLLPVINELGQRAQSDKIKCIVMTPTRELAVQIDQQLEGFGYFLPISSLPIYGGTDGAGYAQQQRGLKAGAEVVIATPGRLLAHISMGYVDLSAVEFFILDEADRMLDMGFYDDIMQIASHLPAQRQTLMFSATMPPKIKKMAQALLHNPVEVKIAVNKPTDKVQQRVYVCRDAEKEALLCHLFGEINSRRVIVFASSKLKVKDLARALRRKKLKVAEMHSDLDQNTREEVMRNFRAGHIDILVATDIVARGIDIDDISMVVNFDVPHDAEDYVHRIGRTARAGETGVAVTLVGERERRKFRAIEDFIGGKIEHSPLPEGFSQVPERRTPAAAPTAADPGKNRRNNRNRAGRNNNRRRSAAASAAGGNNTNNKPNTNKSHNKQKPQQQQ